MSMTPEAKKLLSTTVRALRARLLEDLRAAMETEYRLGVPRLRDAGLGEAAARKRARLEEWLDEQVRAQGAVGKGKKARTREDFRREVEQQAAYTLLNRLVVLRLMEASKLRPEAVVTQGWESPAYKTFRELAPALVQGEASEGFNLLFRLVCEELAADLPGLFGSDGVAALVPVPAATLRHAVEVLDQPGLAPCWTDDMTLGWVYQYWNDPEREALDAKLNARGKLEPHEIASKTQMFTERYMVDWLLQNSLGPMWLAICAKRGWTPEVRADGTLAALEARRAEWRGKRERGEVELTALMPLHTESERHWAYYVEQPLPADAIEKAPKSVREIQLLDPAVGSGHFLVVAFDVLLALYEEERRHRGLAEDAEGWARREIVEQIVENNLHGIDLDARAVQIAAAALWLKARQTCPEAQPRRMWLVASNLRLSSLKKDDPALVELRSAVARETGIPEALTDQVIEALKGADHLGSLLRVDEAVERALDVHEATLSRRAGKPTQGLLFGAEEAGPTGHGVLKGPSFAPEQRELISREEAKTTILDALEEFLKKHSRGDDLGLRLRGEQLAAGVRFVRLVREGTFELVVGNPPYQGTSKMADAGYVQKTYPKGKADLYAAFLERGLQLVRPGGVSALLTMRNWMFIKQYAELRQWLLKNYDLRALGDFAIGAFDEVPNDVLSVVVSVFHSASRRQNESVALQPTPPEDRSYDRERTKRKRAATLVGVGRLTFSPQALETVPEWPVVYWWGLDDVSLYSREKKLGDIARVRQGLATSNNARFLRSPWETRRESPTWPPFVQGASGKKWIEPVSDVVRWHWQGLQMKLMAEVLYQSYTRTIKNEAFYFSRGVAFSMIGASFCARVHRRLSIIGHKGSSVFFEDPIAVLCSMNSTRATRILESLNPGIGFEVGDVNRLPLFPIANADEIFATVEHAFGEHEAHREPSVEFRRPGPSPWRHAQDWAQLAVDRPEGAPLSAYVPEHDPEPPTDHLSYALGIALGRFGADGEGILDPAKDSLAHALPAGILFLDNTLDADDLRDSLGLPAARPLGDAWSAHGPAIAAGADLRGYLSKNFFELHRKMYENRPIHWPLSSSDRTFVAWVAIHRWDAGTLRVLLADHLHPALTRLDGALADLRAARDGADKKSARAAEKRLTTVQKARDELVAFIAAVEQCAEKGPPPPDLKKPEREVDARYVPDLDDGVMINSAALWPLLAPQWKDPKKWWKELAAAEGKKDYDWSHLAMRYWPKRVDDKCVNDPSLAVAHGCFWKYHPARAWAWELRLQDEIEQKFRIEEAPYRGDGGHGAHRTVFLADHPQNALAIVEKEALRRIRKHKRRLDELVLLEPGLWGERPDACWELELRVIDKQGHDFKLRAPDEPEARAALEAKFPDLVKKRRNLLESLRPSDILLGGDEDAGADEADDDDERGEEDDA